MPKINNLTELYLIRHAETVMNTNPHIVGGRSNESPLTDKGIHQAMRLGEALSDAGIMPGYAYASPARRTRETARYSLRAMGINRFPEISDEIQELSQGRAEGTRRAEVYTPEVLLQIDQQGKDFRLEGGESMNDVGERMENWAHDTFGEGDGGTYFVYSHGGAIKYLASRLEGWDRQRTYETEVGNTSLSLFLLQDGELSLGYLNRDAATL